MEGRLERTDLGGCSSNSHAVMRIMFVRRVREEFRKEVKFGIGFEDC